MIHHVFATKSNIGDWLSARGIQSLLAPSPVIEHFCDQPFIAGTLEQLAALDRRDVVVVGGGGLLMDYFEPFWEGMRAIVRRVPVCIWGVGLVDLKRTPSRASAALLADVVGHSRLCAVRDSLTREYLSACSWVEVAVCPATVSVPIQEGPGHHLLYADHYDVVGPAGYEMIRGTVLDFAHATGREYREIDNQIRDGDEVALKAALRCYADAAMVVSSRLHGCIIALSLGRKVLAVSGDRKVEAFMAAAGLADWVCTADDAAALQTKLQLLPRQPSAGAFIESARADNRRIAARVRAIVAEADAVAPMQAVLPVL